jgi:hypothetical protein
VTVFFHTFSGSSSAIILTFGAVETSSSNKLNAPHYGQPFPLQEFKPDALEYHYISNE